MRSRATGISGAWKRVAELVQGGHLVVIGEERDEHTNTMVQVYGLPRKGRCDAGGS